MAEGRGQPLPPGWVWTTLGEAFDIVMGQSLPSSTYNAERVGLPFYQGKAEFGDLYPTPVKWCTQPGKIAEAGDVLISVRAPVGPTNLCQETSCIGRGLSAVRPLCGMPSLYFLYYLRLIEPDWAGKATGTTFAAISGDTLRSAPLPLPPLPEQRRIVIEIETQFTRLDAGVAALKRVQGRLRRYKAAVLQAACEGRLVPTEAELARAEGRDYEPAGVLLQRILAERRVRWEAEHPGKRYQEPEAPDTSKLPALPEGWVWTFVGDIGQVSGGLTKDQRRTQYEVQIPYLRVANVYAHELRLETVETIGVRRAELGRITLQEGDLLIVEGNGSVEQIGRVAIWNGAIAPCVHQNHLIKVRFDPIELARYVLLWLLCNRGRDHITRVASSTSGLYTLSLSKVSALPVPFPPLSEQRRIVAEVEHRLSAAQELERQVELALRRAERLRQAILKRAFEGRLVPQDPSDEPASALLERIRAERRARSAAGPRQPRLPGMAGAEG